MVVERRMDGDRQADPDAAKRIDDADESGEVELNKIVQPDLRSLLKSVQQAVGSAERERRIELLDGFRLGRLSGESWLGRARQNRDDRVAREAEHRDMAPARRDVQDHDRVRTLALGISADLGVL